MVVHTVVGPHRGGESTERELEKFSRQVQHNVSGRCSKFGRLHVILHVSTAGAENMFFSGEKIK